MTPTLSTHTPWYRRLFADTLERWHQRRTVQALQDLDPRMLADIGIDASEISSIEAESLGYCRVTRRRIAGGGLQHA